MSTPIKLELGGAASGSLRRMQNRMFLCLTGAAALTLLVPLFGILGYLVTRGIGAINLDFFISLPKPVGETGGGVANAIVGSLMVIVMAGAAAIPCGVLASVYICEFAPGSRFSSIIRFVCDMLNSTPSIILGIFAYGMVVLRMGHFSALAGAFALFVMMTPVVVRATEEILRTVPNSIREASVGLGGTRWQTVWHVVLPAARSGIVTGVFLALARVGGETAPLLFTAFGNQFWNLDPRQPINTLPVQIYKFATSPYADWHRQAWAAALLLVIMIAVISSTVRALTARR
ncbi:MAG: phosphate ABC transporter permease PstA [Candidatus Sumerlaeaceae bacterium]|nr:phosphate ABC transporter permease PstA [Candidatus Sumerlaeaceae bacterium]